MSNKFSWLNTVLIAVLFIAVTTSSFFLYQTNNELSDIKGQIDGLTSRLSSTESSISSFNSQLASIDNHLTTLDDKTDELLKRSTAIVDSVAKVLPSTVYIEVAYIDPDTNQTMYASGSGVIMMQSGYILTNRHVVEGAIDAIVILQDLRVYYITNIWEDDVLDLAVVKIDAPNLVTATFGDPTTITLGDTVIALGFPLGMSPEEGGATVTSGIVSNLGRSFFIEDVPYYDVIQTDAAINPGNSGGPLINLDGEVIGINCAGTSEAQNISFAINVATARPVFEDLVNFGQSHHPYLGVHVDDYFEQVCGREGCTFQLTGAVVTGLDPTGPGSLAGLQIDDVILKLGDDDIYSAADFIRAFWRLEAGDSISLIIQRNLTQITITLTLPIRPVGSPYI